MKTRILAAAVGILIMIPIILLSDTILLPILMSLFAVVGCYEIVSAVGAKRKVYFLIPSFLYAAAIPFLTADFIYRGAIFYFATVAALTFLYIILMFAVMVLTNGKEVFSHAAEIILGTVYVTVGFAAIALLRNFDEAGYLYLLPIIGAWITDAGAYFVGFFLGKHKLAPVISPKKTVEGSIGGIVFGSASFAVYGLILQLAFGAVPNYVMLAVAGLIVSVISQIGDLSASLIKREHGVKDFGNLMPGHGGVLDRFDSVIAVAPLLVMTCLLPTNFSFFF